MKGKNIKTRILAIVLSVLMIVIGMPLDAQADSQDSKVDFFHHKEIGGDWTSGNVKGYEEGDYVPHRVVYKDTVSNNLVIALEYKGKDNIENSVIGYDQATEWYIAPTTTTGAIHTEGFSVSEPVIGTYKNTEVIKYTVTITEGLLTELNTSNYKWAIYFNAHLSKTGSKNLVSKSVDLDLGGKTISKGSGYFPGASLHSYIVDGGNKELSIDVPNPPERVGSIELKKYVWNGNEFVDADSATGPYLTNDPLFKFVITNDGGYDLIDVNLSDYPVINTFYTDKELKNVATLPIGLLETESSVTLYGKLEWAIGQEKDTATVTGNYTGEKNNTITVTDSDDAYYFGASPAIDLKKLISINGGVTWNEVQTSPGSSISSETVPIFKFVVKNTGNVDLINVDIIDDKLGSISLDGTLKVGIENEYEATGSWLAGQHTNEATVTADYLDDTDNKITVSDMDKSYFYGIVPGIDIEKYIWDGEKWQDADSAPGPYLTKGSIPKFKFVVSNTADVILGNVDITDDILGDINLDGTLKIDDEKVYYMDGTWESGQRTNVATATGDYIDGNSKTVTATDADAANYFGAEPKIEVKKYVSDNGETWHDADTVSEGPEVLSGEKPIFKFIVKNKGNVELNNIILEDNKYDIGGEGNSVTIPSLAANGEYVLTYSAEWEAGQHTNTATVTVVYDNETYSDADDANYVGVTQIIDRPAIEVIKLVSIDGGLTWDDANALPGPELLRGTNPQFKFVVKNTGNVDLSNIKLEDNIFDLSEKVVAYSLLLDNVDKFMIIDYLAANDYETGGEDEFELIITVPWEAGQHKNTATVTVLYDDVPYSDTDDAHYFGKAPAVKEYKLEITKEADVTKYDAVNDVINYTIKVKNAGDTKLTGVTVSDPLLENLTGPTEVVSEVGVLDVGKTWTYTGSYTIVEGDIYRDFVKNIATADSNETDPVVASVTVNYDEPGNPPETSRYRLTIEKEADVKEYSAAGEEIVYTITLRNTGNRALTGVEVTDPMLEDLSEPEGDADDDNQLDVNEKWIYTGTYTVTEDDMEKDSITNTAEAESDRTGPVEDSVTVDRADEEIEIIPDPEETPLGGEPVVPEVIEESEVALATLPDTGSIFNTTIIAAIGLLLIIAGVFINKIRFIKG